MKLYKNNDYQARVYVDLRRADGTTLELGPGEEIELNLPDDFEDAYLKLVVELPKKSKKPEQEPVNA